MYLQLVTKFTLGGSSSSSGSYGVVCHECNKVNFSCGEESIKVKLSQENYIQAKHN